MVALRKESVDRNSYKSLRKSWDAWSLSARRAWIEISSRPPLFIPILSLSARRAWIEICRNHGALHGRRVALRKESVDRNRFDVGIADTVLVALRKESVDRNSMAAATDSKACSSLSARRAWIEMSSVATLAVLAILSLSARRAWIEMYAASCYSYFGGLSLSARRAWIEMCIIKL